MTQLAQLLQPLKKSLILAAVFSFIVIMAVFIALLQHPFWPSIGATLSLIPIVFIFFAISSQGIVFALSVLQKRRTQAIFFLPFVYIVPYLLYCLTTATFNWWSLGKFLLMLYIPLAILFGAKRWKKKANPLDLLAVLAIWLPFEMNWLNDMWNFPPEMQTAAINMIVAISYGLLLFSCYRNTSKIGYSLITETSHWRTTSIFTEYFY